ncbi:(2Fe-2S)-binding protein [Herpetosiphon sp. NSE202]|uniref:(2Fe-2S)-binding protein n=1 Tax=Herpetosiphon sp. NSE202 TaxID=3351349 RepID=UPI0036318FE2
MLTQDSQPLVVDSAWSPLAATIARVSALDSLLAAVVLPAPTADWLRISDLLDPTAQPVWFDELLTQIMARYSLRERRTAATFLFGSYAWYVMASAIASYLSDRRVPSIAIEDMAIRFDVHGDEPHIQVALLTPGFAALPDDPAANQPMVTVCANLDELREHLRNQIETHMQVIINFLSTQVRSGPRGQWNMVADTCAEIALWIGHQMGDQELACAEALSLIKVAGSPMRPSPTRYMTLTEGDHCETFRMRGSCCLFYKIPTTNNCNTCPLLSEDERIERLRTWMQHDHNHDHDHSHN